MVERVGIFQTVLKAYQNHDIVLPNSEITTAPIITPIIIGLGYDPVWFGILLMVMLETALITPPIGVNLYVVQGVRGRGSMNDIMVGIIPFVLTMFVMLALLVAFPDIALWLPNQFY